MNKTVTAFLVGAVAGAALVTFMRTPPFRKGASRLVSAGMQLKKDASAFVESIKEDAEDDPPQINVMLSASAEGFEFYGALNVLSCQTFNSRTDTTGI